MNYINAPLMLGVNYELSISGDMGIFAEVGAGANVRFITNMSYEDSGNNWSISENFSFDPSLKFAYQIGGGINLNESLSIGISYFNLGKDRIEGKLKYKYEESYGGDTYRNSDSEDFKLHKLQTEIVTIRLGFTF